MAADDLARRGDKSLPPALPSDDDAADRLFQAALEFYTEVGTYCVNSGRAVRFSRQEILLSLVSDLSGLWPAQEGQGLEQREKLKKNI